MTASGFCRPMDPNQFDWVGLPVSLGSVISAAPDGSWRAVCVLPDGLTCIKRLPLDLRYSLGARPVGRPRLVSVA